MDRSQDFTISYVGDGNNVAYSWITAAAMFGLKLSVGCPASCKPELPKGAVIPDSIEITEDPIAAVSDADVIYTDVWISMGQEETSEKVSLLKPYQINQSLVDAAKKDALVMHCLPAHREMEITSEVLEGKHSIVFDQAENRLHMQKSILRKILSLRTESTSS